MPLTAPEILYDTVGSATQSSGVAVTAGSLSGALVIITGTFVGTFDLQVDDGVGGSWVSAKDRGGVAIADHEDPAVFVLGELPAESDIRIDCTAWTSGDIQMVVVQGSKGTRSGSADWIDYFTNLAQRRAY